MIYTNIYSRFSINYKNRIWKHEVMVKKAERSEGEGGGGGHQLSGATVTTNGGWPGTENGGAVSHSAYQGAGITPIG